DIYAARAALELAAVDALTGHRDPAVYQNLADLVGEIEQAFDRGDTAAVLDGDRLFHATLVAATGSPRLRRFYRQLQQEQRLALALSQRSRRDPGPTDHAPPHPLHARPRRPAHPRPHPPPPRPAGPPEPNRRQDRPPHRNQPPHREEGETPHGPPKQRPPLGPHRRALAPRRAHP